MAAPPKRITFFLLRGSGCCFQPLSSTMLKALPGPHDRGSGLTSQRPPCEKEDAITLTTREYLTSSKNGVASRASNGEKYFDAVNVKSPSERS